MRASSTLLAVLLVPSSLAIAAPAAADRDPCEGELITIGLGDATPYATFYYVITGDTPDEGWGYVETNDLAGLQRGPFNNLPFPSDVGDPCFESDISDFNWY